MKKNEEGSVQKEPKHTRMMPLCTVHLYGYYVLSFELAPSYLGYCIIRELELRLLFSYLSGDNFGSVWGGTGHTELKKVQTLFQLDTTSSAPYIYKKFLLRHGIFKLHLEESLSMRPYSINGRNRA
jgi:hypothetical protein